MANATRWYATIEAVKAATESLTTRNDALLGAYIEAASEHIENLLGRRFIPQTQTRYYPWPQVAGNSLVVYLDEDLLAVTLLQTAAQDASPTTIAASDYFLEPVNRPPYRRIEIDRSSTSSFVSGDTSQRSIAVTGRWAYAEATKAAGALAEALDDSETGVDVSNASLIGVGDTLLIESEQMFVSGRSLLTTATTLNDASVTADINDVTLTVADGTKIKAGELITIDSERMYVESISGNDLTVRRQADGSVLAAHTTGVTIYAGRTLTVVRGVNGTTAASHADTTAISKYAPEATVRELCVALTLATLKQGQAAWSGQLGADGRSMVEGLAIPKLEEEAVASYGVPTF